MAFILRSSQLFQLNSKATQSAIRLLTTAPKQARLTLFKPITVPKQALPTPLVSQRLASQSVGHHSSKHWNAERFLSLGLLAILPACFYAENFVGDIILSSTLMLHSWWGLQQLLIDYLHGPIFPKIGFGILNIACLLGFVGLIYFNYYDMGLAKALKRIWYL